MCGLGSTGGYRPFRSLSSSSSTMRSASPFYAVVPVVGSKRRRTTSWKTNSHQIWEQNNHKNKTTRISTLVYWINTRAHCLLPINNFVYQTKTCTNLVFGVDHSTANRDMIRILIIDVSRWNQLCLMCIRAPLWNWIKVDPTIRITKMKRFLCTLFIIHHRCSTAAGAAVLILIGDTANPHSI